MRNREHIEAEEGARPEGSSRSLLPAGPVALERVVADLEGGGECVAFASGAEAVDAALQLLPAGASVLASPLLRGGRWTRHPHGRHLVPVEFDPREPAVRVDDRTGSAWAAWVESPTEPGLEPVDLPGLARGVHRAGGVLFVDNSRLTGFVQRPLDLGADLVVYSGTETLAWPAPAKAGFLVTRSSRTAERLRAIRHASLSATDSGDAWILLQGARNLPHRAGRMRESARRIATRLSTHPRVLGLRRDVAASLEPAAPQDLRSGWTIAFEVAAPWLAPVFLASLRRWVRSETHGSGRSTVSHPATDTHRDLPATLLRRHGISESLVRLAVGLEPPEDLIEDLEQALDQPYHGSGPAWDWVI